MTCIVGVVWKGDVLLGGDRAGVEQSHYLSIVNEPKVFKLGDFVIGFTTSFRMGQIIQHRFVPPALPEADDDLHRYMAVDFVQALRVALREAGWLKTDNSREEGGVFLVGVRGRLFTVDSDFNVLSRTNGFDACGSGISVALGAMHALTDAGPSYRVLKALEAAEAFTTSVRRPFDLVSTEAWSDA